MAKKIQSTAKVTDNSVMLCLLFIVMGVLFVWLEAGVAAIAMMTIGVIATVLGLFELFHKNWIMGIIELVIGIALIVVAALAPRCGHPHPRHRPSCSSPSSCSSWGSRASKA